MQNLLTIQVPSSTKPWMSWTVTKSPRTGAWYCECPAWRYQRKPGDARTCKHITSLAMDLAVHVGDKAQAKV
jgi:hypothetical protein